MAQGTAVSVQPSVLKPAVGEKFRIAIHVENVTDLYAWQVDLHWNPNILSCTAVTLGPFGPQDIPAQLGPDNNEGWLLFACSLLGDKPGISGSGDILYVDFEVKAAGASPLALLENYTYLINSSLGTIPCTVESGVVYAGGVEVAVLYGVVTDTKGKELKGASVTLDASSTTTVRDGFYTFFAPPGSYTLKASMPGYLDHTQTVDMPTTGLHVKNVTLLTSCTLSGTVTNSITGAPVKDATITLDTSYSTTTDENGNYTISVPQAKYSMTVSKSGYVAHTQDLDLSTSTSYRKDVQLTPLQYNLTVQSEPISVPVTINGSLVGNTPVSQPIYCESSVTVEVPQTYDRADFINYTLDGEPHGENPITFTMPSRDVTLTAYYELPFDFTVSVSPTSGTVRQGEMITATVTVTRVSGPTQTVTLSASGLPPDATALFQPSADLPTFDSTLFIFTATTTPTGTYPITITASDGGLTRTTTYTLTVISAQAPDFSISVSPTSLTIPQGKSKTATVTITSINGFSQEVALSVSGAPAGVTTSFDPPSVTPPADGSITSTLTVTVDKTVQPGTYTLTITGTSGTISHDTSLTLQVVSPDFSISVSPTSLTIQQGQSKTATVTVTSINSFSQPVSLTVTGVPAGVTATFDKPTVTPPPDGTVTSTLRITVGTTVEPKTYTLTITGTSDTLTHSTPLTLQVTLPPPPTAILEGRVTGIFGPVANATVRLNTAYTAKTDASGSYQITDITLGTYTLTVEPPFPWSLIYAKRTQTVNLTEPTTYELNISLSINKATVLATTAGIGIVLLAFTLKPKG
jgi:uncharacterized membrane protein